MIVSMSNTDIFVGQGSVAWEPDKRTLVLLHGAGMDRTAWVLLARYFARHGYNVVSPDFPAHGASGGSVLGSIENQANFVWELLDLLQQDYGLPAQSVMMAGHSMGALVAGEAASQRPEAVEHLLVFGSGYPMPVGQPLLDAAPASAFRTPLWPCWSEQGRECFILICKPVTTTQGLRRRLKNLARGKLL